MTLRIRCGSTLILTIMTAAAMLAQQPPASKQPSTAKPANSQPQGQTTTKAEDGKPSETTKAAEVPPDAPVITINGLCPNKPAITTGGKTPADCKTVITRAQFEDLTTALNPNMTASLKRQLAEVYPRILLLSHEGEQLGIQNEEQFKKTVQFEMKQILAQETAKSLGERAAQISDQQLEQYYKENGTKFEEFTLQRVFIPNPDQAASTEKEKLMKPEQVKALAEKIHAEAVAGQDFDKLQKEAFDAVGLKSTAPTTKVEKLTRGSLPESQNSVFDLKPGTVSQVFADPGAYYIYKVVSKQMPPFDSVKEELKRTLQTERLQNSMKAVLDSAKTDLNTAYFAETTSAIPQRTTPDAARKITPNKSPH